MYKGRAVTDVVNDGSGRTVLDVLHQKHPSSQPPRASFLVRCDDFLLFKDAEITGSHLLSVAIAFREVLDLVVVMLIIGGTCCFGLVLTVPNSVMLLLPLLVDF